MLQLRLYNNRNMDKARARLRRINYINGNKEKPTTHTVRMVG